MPLFDAVCLKCGEESEVYVSSASSPLPPCPKFHKSSDEEGAIPTECTGELEVIRRPHRVAVIGDEIDYIADNLGPHPVRIRSREQRKRLMKEQGLVEVVRHVGVPGSDKSPETTNWGGSSSYTLDAATALVSRGSQGTKVPDTDVLDLADGRTLGLKVGKTFSGVLDSEFVKEVNGGR